MNDTSDYRFSHRPAPATRTVAEGTREKLLDAAELAFADHGFEGATVREICLRAGANIAAVNYYFGDKLNLYTEVLRRFARKLDVEATLSDRTAAPEAVLRMIVRMRLRGVFTSQNPDLPFRVMMHEWAHPTPAMDRVLNETLRPLYDRFRDIVGAIIGLPRDHETTRLCVHSVMGQAMHYVHGRPILAKLWPELTMTPDQVDRIADHIADFSLAYLQSFKSARRRRAPGTRERKR